MNGNCPGIDAKRRERLVARCSNRVLLGHQKVRGALEPFLESTPRPSGQIPLVKEHGQKSE
jgi:hypothetical protein